MRLIALAAFAGLLTTAAHADTMVHCAAAWKAKTAEATAALAKIAAQAARRLVTRDSSMVTSVRLTCVAAMTVSRAAQILSNPAGFAISGPSITFSTAGHVPAIRRYVLACR